MVRRSRCFQRWGILLVLVILVIPRLIALDADPPPSLDWNPGIWTDEGFYTYNARNFTLFGQADLDEWNNRWLSPLLEIVQRAVFGHWGVSLISARAISVAASIVAMAFFADAMRRWFGARVGVTALLLLGGESTLIFYNRLALLETPALAVICMALWALSWERPIGWVFSGFLAAAVIAVKTTFLLFLPIPLLVWAWRWSTPHFRVVPIAWYGVGALTGIGLYLALWGIPHGAEIWRLNHFYATRQSEPHSIGQALHLGIQSVGGERKGLLQFLETRSPILTTLALIAMLFPPLSHTMTLRAARRQDVLRMFWLWVILGWVALGFSRYAPTRYYLVIYPALAALSAHMIWNLPRIIRNKRGTVRIWLPVFGLAYHILLPAFSLLTQTLYALPAATVACMVTLGLRRVWTLRPCPELRALPLTMGLLTVFVLISSGQWLYWYGTRGYETRTVSFQLAEIVRPDQIIAGDWAPNLCLNNRLRGVPVLPDLANWRDPVAELHASYVLLTETPYPRRYWQAHAPAVVVPGNLVRRFNIHGHHLSLFRVPIQ